MESTRLGGNSRQVLRLAALVASNLGFAAAAYLYGQFGTQQVLACAVLVGVGLIAGVMVIGTARARAVSSSAILARLDAADQGDLDALLGADALGTGAVQKRASALFGRLRAAVMDVQLGTQDLCGAGESILEAIAQQARGAAEQSSAASQTSAAVEEMNASAQEAAVLAETVASTARDADRIAADGVSAVQAARDGIDAMRENVDSIT